MTEEVMALCSSDDKVNGKKSATAANMVFIAKAIILLSMARKNPNANYVSCNSLWTDSAVSNEDFLAFIDGSLVEHLMRSVFRFQIPEYVFDVHTYRGKKGGKTRLDFFIDENKALKPLQPGLFDNRNFREFCDRCVVILIKRKFDEYAPAIIGIDSANIGLTMYQQLRHSGLPVIELKPDADKYTRAIPAAARYESGMVYHREGAHWLNDLEAELLAFPNGVHDDQVDVISYAVYMQSWGYLNEKKRGGRALVLG